MMGYRGLQKTKKKTLQDITWDFYRGTEEGEMV